MAQATAPILDSTEAAVRCDARIRPLLEAQRTFREALLPAGATRMTHSCHLWPRFFAAHI
jgi:hypothetical protein